MKPHLERHDQRLRTEYVTAVVDLQRRVVADVVEGRKGSDLRRWLKSKGSKWLYNVKVVATDLTGSYRSGMASLLDHAIKVVDGFHVVQAANRAVTSVRCRVHNELFGHRGRKDDPLYQTRKLLLTGDNKLDGKGRARLLEGLRFGDPNDEVLGSWLAKEMIRDVYLTDDTKLAKALPGKAIRACKTDPVPEVKKTWQIVEQMGDRNLEPPSDSSIKRADRRVEPVHQKSETSWARIPQLRQLPAPCSTPRWRLRLDPTRHPRDTQPKPQNPTQMRRALLLEISCRSSRVDPQVKTKISTCEPHRPKAYR